MNADDIDTIVSQYLKLFPDERAGLAALIDQIANDDVLNNRKTMPGHITGAAIVLSPDRQKLLMIHHNQLQLWLQPGGHWDPGEPDPLAAAQREAEEETSVLIADYLPLIPEQPLIPFRLETHTIPANPKKEEPMHYHHDFRYVFVAASEELQAQEAEVSQVGWFAFDAPECVQLQKEITRLRTRGIIAA